MLAATGLTVRSRWRVNRESLLRLLTNADTNGSINMRRSGRDARYRDESR